MIRREPEGKTKKEVTFNIVKDIIWELNNPSIDYREMIIEDRVKEFAEEIKYLKGERLEWAILRFIDKLNDPSDKVRQHVAETIQKIVDEISKMSQRKLEFVVRKLLGRLEERNDRVYEHLATVVSGLAAKRPEVFKDKVDILFLKLDRSCKDPYRLDELPHDEFAGFPNRCQHARTAIAEAILEVSKKFPQSFYNRISNLAKLLHDSNDEVILIALEIIEKIGHEKPEVIKNIIRDLVTCLSHDAIRSRAVYILRNHAENNIDILKEEVDLLFEALMDSFTDWDTVEQLIDIIYVVWKKYPRIVEEGMRKMWRELTEENVWIVEWFADKYPKIVLSIIPQLKEALYSEWLEIRRSAIAALLGIAEDYPQLVEDTLPRLTELLIKQHLFEEDPDIGEEISKALEIIIKKYPWTIDDIVPKLAETLPKLITETKKFSETCLKNASLLLKTLLSVKPEAFKEIISLLAKKLKDKDDEIRRRTLLLLEGIERKPEKML